MGKSGTYINLLVPFILKLNHYQDIISDVFLIHVVLAMYIVFSTVHCTATLRYLPVNGAEECLVLLFSLVNPVRKENIEFGSMTAASQNMNDSCELVN